MDRQTGPEAHAGGSQAPRMDLSRGNNQGLAPSRCFPQRFHDTEQSERFECCPAGGLREPRAWAADSLSPAQSAWRGSRCLRQRQRGLRPWGLCGAIWVKISSDICVCTLQPKPATSPRWALWRRDPGDMFLSSTALLCTDMCRGHTLSWRCARACVCALCVCVCIVCVCARALCVHVRCSAWVCVRVQLQSRSHPADVLVPKARSQAQSSALPRLEVLGLLPEGRGGRGGRRPPAGPGGLRC